VRSLPWRRALCLAVVVFGLVPATPAVAGNFLATGHDGDFHCSQQTLQCHYVSTAVNFVRSGAPTPSKPVLVLDTAANEVGIALDDAFGVGVVPRTRVAPTDPAFATLPLTTANYSAIIVASDSSCGGCDLNATGGTPDSDAINARSADIKAFLNEGGGLLYLAGAENGNGPGDPYYASVPLGVQGTAVSPPFTLTPAGQALGFQDSTNGIGTNDDINCCPTHNSFAEPAAPLQVAERDATNTPETIFASNVVVGGGGFGKAGKVSARGTFTDTTGGTVQMSAANNCAPALSTRAFIAKWAAGTKSFTKTSVTSSTCTLETSLPSSPAGFNQQVGVAAGTLQDGSSATISWTFKDGGAGGIAADKIQFVIKNAAGATIETVNEQSGGSLSGTPGGVWTFAP
jgi:hypothetical protein